MKVLRNLFIALSFGFMMSCSSSPVDKEIDALEAVVEKAEACKTMDEFNALENDFKEAMKKMEDAVKAEAGENATKEKLEEVAKKYEGKVKDAQKRLEAVYEKLSK